MRNAEHLTIEQLRAYAADTVEKPARREIGAHLIGCPDCRARLPKPSPEQFLAALFTENTIDETDVTAPTAQVHSRHLEKSSIFSVVESSFFNKNLATATGAFVLFAGFLLFGWWLTATRNSGGETANSATPLLPATVAENKNAAPEQAPMVAQTDDGYRNAQQPTNKNSIAKTVEDFADKPQKQRTGGDAKVSPQSNLIARQSRETETESENATEREIAALLEKTPPSVASLNSNGAAVLRSGDNNAPPSNKQSFNLNFPVGETVLDAKPEFRWQAIPTAKNYQISILDSSYDEIASATVTEPVFKLDKPLVRGEIYLWRVAAKTDAGEVIVPQPPAPPVRFRVADQKTEKQIAESQKRADGKLARAALLAREGMLDPAAQLLREILRENPRHKSARRLLNRVVEWQRTAR